jgi:hypothetical protein
MNPDEKNEGAGTNPDTNTDDEIGGLDIPNPEVREAIPVAEGAPVESSPPASEDEAPPPPAPTGPRVFPQHYSILFGSVVVLVGAMSVWERAHVFGVDVSGPQMISGTLLIAMALYCVIVGVINIITGRLRGMFAVFLTGVFALYLSIKGYMRTLDADAVVSEGGETLVRGFLSRDQIKTLPGEHSFQLDLTTWVSQFGPGVWITLIGGILITLVFLKAIVGGGKKGEAAPAAASNRSGGARRSRR